MFNRQYLLFTLFIILFMSTGCQILESRQVSVVISTPTKTPTPFVLKSLKVHATSSPSPTATTEPTATSTKELIVELSPTATKIVPTLTVTKENKPTPTEEPIQTGIKVGSKQDGKQELLSQMLVLALQQAGLEAEERTEYSV